MTNGRCDRRTLLRGLGAAGVLAVLAGCTRPFADVRLRLATGATEGVYFAVGTALAREWQEQLELTNPPQVRSTAGSVDNMALLVGGAADVVFSQVDVAATVLATLPPSSPRQPRALGRVYDELVQIVVPRDSPVQTVAQLRGLRVSMGAPQSGVFPVAEQVVQAAGLTTGDLHAVRLGLNDSLAALRSGSIDAFFWTGGVPTGGIDALAQHVPLRLIDLHDLLPDLRKRHPVYSVGTVPARVYGAPSPVATLLVRNFLLVDAGMPDDLAYALIETVFKRQEQISAASPQVRSIDPRAAIGTQPVPLHPGAVRYFREVKDA